LASTQEPAAVERLRARIVDVRNASFPELSTLPLEVEPFTSDRVFFMSNVDVVAALDGALVLRLLVNVAVLQNGPSEAAIDAILAHELAHSLDYAERFSGAGRAGLLGLLPMLVWPPAEEDVERRTDLVAVARGYGLGLIAYRRWLYATLPAEAVLEKRRVYYSPLELDWLTRVARRCPTALAAALRAPPRSAAAIARLAEDHGGGRCFDP
jgi:hypothetical protein